MVQIAKMRMNKMRIHAMEEMAVWPALEKSFQINHYLLNCIPNLSIMVFWNLLSSFCLIRTYCILSNAWTSSICVCTRAWKCLAILTSSSKFSLMALLEFPNNFPMLICLLNTQQYCRMFASMLMMILLPMWLVSSGTSLLKLNHRFVTTKMKLESASLSICIKLSIQSLEPKRKQTNPSSKQVIDK